MHINYSKLHFGHRWLTHFGCASGFSGLCRAFLGWSFISKCGAYSWSSFLRRRTSCFGHFVLMCHLLTFLSHLDRTYFFFLYVSFGGFNKIIVQVCGDIVGPRSWESIQGPLMKCQAQLLISFGGIGLLSMEDCTLSTLLGNWALVASYLCSKFCIFNETILEEYVY